MNVEPCSVKRFRALQGRKRRRGLSSFEIGETEPMLELCVARPAGDRFLSDSCGLGQTAQLEIAQHQTAVGFQTVWSDLPGAFETGGGSGIVVGVQSGLGGTQEGLNSRCLCPDATAGSQQQQ